MIQKAVRMAVVFALMLLVLIPLEISWAKGWEKIPQSEQALASVPWAPSAPAVVLFHNSSIVLSPKGSSSHREEHVRVKILAEEGKEYGSVRIPSSEYHRLRDLEARTISPDGTEVPLAKDAVFEKTYSAYYRQQLTTFAMPNVSVGSIIEYKYSIYFDRALTFWEIYFQDELPILSREVSFEKPHRYEFNANYIDPAGGKPTRETHESRKALIVTYSASNMAPVPDEPFRPPFVDLSARVQFVPRVIYIGGQGTTPLSRSWKNLADVFKKYIYEDFVKGSKRTRARAKELVAGLSTDEERAAAVYRFVRDEIATDPSTSISVGDTTSDRVLEEGEGTPTEKALVLQTMLAAVDIDSSLGWTNLRADGDIHLEFPGISRLGRTLVVMNPDGERIFLDAADPDAAFGYLQPELENVLCLLLAGEKPDWVRTPELSDEDSRRAARIDLQVEDGGRIVGSGELTLTGHHAWRYLNWKDTPDAAAAAWTEWLADRHPGYDINETKVTESVDDGHIAVTWVLAQRAEEVLGDEATIRLAAPLALQANPFTLEVEERQTKVFLSFADQEEVETHVVWPESWQIDIEPRWKNAGSLTGKIATELEVDAEARTLHAKRTFTQTSREVAPNWVYGELRQIYQICVENDAETLVLARRE